MKQGEMLAKMLILATNGHNGQFDKGGKPYILHCLKVMHQLRTEDEELQCIALGHDLIEDTNTTYQDLSDDGISQRVIDGIKCLTKMRGETYQEYKDKVKSNSDAITVKMSDLRHNSDILRLKNKTITEKDIARIVKYHQFYLELEELCKIV